MSRWHNSRLLLITFFFAYWLAYSRVVDFQDNTIGAVLAVFLFILALDEGGNVYWKLLPFFLQDSLEAAPITS